MKYSRKEFITRSAGALLAPIAIGAGGWINAAPVAGIPRNAAERNAYTRMLLDQLCTAIGPRATGSEHYAAGAAIIHGEFKKSLPVVDYDDYAFDRWELIGRAGMEVGKQEIETDLAFGSRGTPENGLSGILSRQDSGFIVVHPENKELLANISVNKYGRSIPVDRSTDPTLPPLFGVGYRDVPLLEEAVQSGSPVRLHAQVRFSSDGKGINVIGRLPGKQPDEILFLAHADTMYTTPGAIDNTASVIVMMMLAHEAAKRGNHKHTLTFAATDGEEYGLLGAKHYAKVRSATDTMKNIRYVINFDSLAWGPNLWVNSLNDEIKMIIRSIHSDLGLKSYPRFESNDGFSMDSAPFRPSEARAAHINSRGYDAQTLPRYHRADDLPQHVPLDCTEQAFRVFDEFIQRVDRL
ncbi:M28 family metallopeptidase [Parapedobacter lycopersici]|uniref:M28 family metallopeptidase n=1 Tax=Parapedobacter lycopersici TaxID=1864939 RepID=UPI00214D4034|nr:M28 family metallopeptidase [Parapedobacter lycopersici]